MLSQRDHRNSPFRVLIVSCGTGGGHNACAQAIQENLISHGMECEFLEFYDLVNRHVSHSISAAYLHSIKRPQVFDSIYRIGNFYSEHHRHRSPVYLANRSCGRLLADHIEAGGFNLVITTHLFAAEALTAIRKTRASSVPTLGVCTDYTCIPLWEDTSLDRYLVPHTEVKDDFVARGVHADRIISLGIPVASRFTEHANRQTLRSQLCQRHGLDPHLPLIVVMSGSMGFGNLHELMAHLIIRSHAHGGCNIIVSCGNNAAVAYELETIYGDDPHTIVCGYLADEDLYIGGCDVLVSKPGGLTTTEACAMRTPLVLCSPIPGCETENRRFLVEHGCAAGGETFTAQVNSVFLLMENAEMRESMMAAQTAIIDPHTADKVSALAKRLVISNLQTDTTEESDTPASVSRLQHDSPVPLEEQASDLEEIG